jgi:ATP-binding cassette subfamily B (MDR/TAP) protein 9
LLLLLLPLLLGSVLQVRAHAATDSAKSGYDGKLQSFYQLMCRQAAAYSIYIATTTFLPSVVVAVVLYYGGLLVLNGRMSAGSLVSFMLYQQSLSSAFSMLGDVFSALTAAVGAADKVGVGRGGGGRGTQPTAMQATLG